jgi:hypothetical protein
VPIDSRASCSSSMKRAASRTYRQSGSKRGEEEIREIRGQIEEIVYPQFEGGYDGFFVGRIAGLRVVGALPFLDKHFIFTMTCSLEASRYGEPQWRIKSMGKPGFEPVPLSFNLLRVMLKDQEGFNDAQSEFKIAELRSLTSGRIHDEYRINPDYLMNITQPNPPSWLQRMADTSVMFKYNALKSLTLYWKAEVLAALKMDALLELCGEVDADIARFCFRTTTMFSLPVVDYKDARQYYASRKRPEPGWLVYTQKLYNDLCSFTARTKQLAVSPEVAAREWHCAPGMKSARDQGVIQLVTLKDVDGRVYGRLMMDDDARDLKYVADRLNTLQIRPVDALQPLVSARVDLGELNQEQKAAVEAIFSTNLLIVTGVAGTGKTTKVAKKISEYYGKKRIMPLAYYGSAAAILRSVFGKGMTVHKMRAEIDKESLNADIIELAILDEASTVTLELMKIVLSLPNLKKLVLIGDPRQMNPPTPGPILRDLLLRYEGTPVVRKLTRIMRVAGQSERAVLHRDILSRLYERDFSVPYSSDLDSDCPFIVLPRIQTADKLASVKASMSPLVRKGVPFQTLTQKNETVDLCNQALFQHLYGDQSYSRGDLLLGEKVMLLENYYSTYRPKDASGDNPPPAGYSRKTDPEWILRTDEVCNGEVSRIKWIRDIHPVTLRRVGRASTGLRLEDKGYHRVVKLDSGKQINLHDYPLRNLTRGECCTVAKSQGLQYPTVVMYIHEGFSRTLSQRQLTTAIGRGSERFVIICAPFEDGLENSEIGKILKTPEPEVEPILAVLLRPYQEPTYAGPLPENPDELDDIDEFLV